MPAPKAIPAKYKAGWVVGAGAILLLLAVLWEKRRLEVTSRLVGDVEVTGSGRPGRVVIGPALPPVPSAGVMNWNCPRGSHVEWDNGTAVCVED